MFFLFLWCSLPNSILWQRFIIGLGNQLCQSLTVIYLSSSFSTSGTWDYFDRILQPPFIRHLDLWRRRYWPLSFQDAALDGHCRGEEKNKEERKCDWKNCRSLTVLFCFSSVDNFVLHSLSKIHRILVSWSYFRVWTCSSKDSSSQNSQWAECFYGDPTQILMV